MGLESAHIEQTGDNWGTSDVLRGIIQGNQPVMSEKWVSSTDGIIGYAANYALSRQVRAGLFLDE